MPRGRPNGSKNLVAEIEGWHGEPVEAKLRGVTVTQLRRHARDGVWPMPVKIGQHVYYKDGDLGRYFETLYRRRNEPQVVRRGRPRAHATA